MSFFNKEEKHPEEETSMTQEQPQVQGQGTPYYQPMIMPSEKADLYDKIRPEDTVEELQYRMMGYEFNKDTQRWEEKIGMKYKSLNKLGAFQIATLLLPVSNKGIPITKTEDDDIRARTKQLVRTAMRDMLHNWREYEITSPEVFYFIKEIIISQCFFTLKQSEGGGGRRFIQGASQEVKTITETSEKKGGLSGMFRR